MDLKVEDVADFIDDDETLIAKSLDIFTKFQAKPKKEQKASVKKK